MIVTDLESRTKYCPMMYCNPMKWMGWTKSNGWLGRFMKWLNIIDGRGGLFCCGSECMWWAAEYDYEGTYPDGESILKGRCGLINRTDLCINWETTRW